METEILKALHELELKERVHILLASEVGSRAWGYASSTSDYDVRFIYVYPPEHYLSIDNPNEGIDLAIKDQLDLRGWELRKTLRLFRKSNPSLFEALHSPVIYKKNEVFFSRMTQLEAGTFSKRTCYSHYYHMARQNLKMWENAENPSVKLLFHCLRPVLMCKWLEENPVLPPLSLAKLLDQLASFQNPLFEALNGKRKHFGDRIGKKDPEVMELSAFIADTFRDMDQKTLEEDEREKEQKTGLQKDSTNDVLNDLFRHMLKMTFPNSF